MAFTGHPGPGVLTPNAEFTPKDTTPKIKLDAARECIIQLELTYNKLNSRVTELIRTNEILRSENHLLTDENVELKLEIERFKQGGKH